MDASNKATTQPSNSDCRAPLGWHQLRCSRSKNTTQTLMLSALPWHSHASSAIDNKLSHAACASGACLITSVATCDYARLYLVHNYYYHSYHCYHYYYHHHHYHHHHYYYARSYLVHDSQSTSSSEALSPSFIIMSIYTSVPPGNTY